MPNIRSYAEQKAAIEAAWNDDHDFYEAYLMRLHHADAIDSEVAAALTELENDLDADTLTADEVINRMRSLHRAARDARIGQRALVAKLEQLAETEDSYNRTARAARLRGTALKVRAWTGK